MLKQYNLPVDTDVLSNIASRSINPNMHVLSSFIYVGIYHFVDMYSIFDFDPMHVLSPGISELLKKCVVAMLGDSQRRTSVMKMISGSCRPLRSIHPSVFHCLNSFIANFPSRFSACI